jgi:hypothetical protein
MKPGDLLQEGVVCSHDSRGVLVGREALPGERFESPPVGHVSFQFGALVVFLSKDQAPIPPAGLHKRVKGKEGAGFRS